MARLGRPDLGLVTASELIETTRLIGDRVDIPVIVDGDTGFGGILNLQRTLRQLEAAGAAAVVIEDQSFPKRCGHMAGKEVVPVKEAVERIRAAADARGRMLLIARTDALGIEGVDAACDRAAAYREVGADALFVEGPRTMAEAQKIAERFPDAPLFHNLVEGGTTPSTQADDFFALGYAATLHPLLLLHGLAASAPYLLETLRNERSTDSLSDEIADLAAMNRITGAQELLDRDDSYS